YATSPLVIINTRMPYHTASIPLWTCLFFYLFYKGIQENNKMIPWAFFVLGLLMQVELSNGVVFFIVCVLYLLYRPKLPKSLVVKSLVSFLLGILPFIMYDITHRFVQTLGLPLWVFNRIRLFFGLTISHNSTTIYAPQAINRISTQIAEMIFPASILVV